MNYLLALKEKNVKKEDLSKKLQSKIDNLKSLIESRDNVDENELEAYDKSILELDAEIIKGIKKFNPEVQRKRLESIKNLNERRGIKPKVEEKPPVEISVEEPIEEKNEEVEEDKIDDNLSNLRQISLEAKEFRNKLKAQYEKHKPEEYEPEEYEPEEIQDFQKDTEKKPKKSKSLSFGLIGIGLFFLTWGAVNLYKQK